jgi:hypothetical protein
MMSLYLLIYVGAEVSYGGIHSSFPFLLCHFHFVTFSKKSIEFEENN